MLTINDYRVTKKEMIVLDESSQKITHFFGVRGKYTDLGNLKD
jgi:hypothetical protein